ncbi:MAG: acyl-CoA thioesterase [Candidatus Eiseniibacteriota bacterium]
MSTIDGYRLAVPIVPRFRDTDAMGHLNNAVYVTYFEVARAAYWLALTGDTNYQRVPFILAHTTIDFRSPAFVSETLEVGIRIARVGTKSFTFEYRIEEQATRRLVCDGRSVQVVFDYESGESRPVPDELRAALRKFENRPDL